MQYKNSEMIDKLLEILEVVQNSAAKIVGSTSMQDEFLLKLPKAAIINFKSITFVNCKGEVLFEDSEIVYTMHEPIKLNYHEYAVKNVQVIFYEDNPFNNFVTLLAYIWRIKWYLEKEFDTNASLAFFQTLQKEEHLSDAEVFHQYFLYITAEFEAIIELLEGTVPTQAQTLMLEYEGIEYPNKDAIIRDFQAALEK